MSRGSDPGSLRLSVAGDKEAIKRRRRGVWPRRRLFFFSGHSLTQHGYVAGKQAGRDVTPIHFIRAALSVPFAPSDAGLGLTPLRVVSTIFVENSCQFVARAAGEDLVLDREHAGMCPRREDSPS